MDFDVIVLGTGVSESIAAAALSKAGFKVAHVDNNQYYGGDEASLTLDELAEWADIRSGRRDVSSSDYLATQKAKYTSVSRSESVPPQARQYAVSLAPSIVPSIGPHIDALIASGVSRYGSFKLLEKVAVYDSPGLVQSVPGSKEDVFKSKALSLIEKRRLMRFLMFAAGEFEGKKELEGKEQTPFVRYLREVFSLDDKAVNAIAYALAFCTSGEESTLPALQRIRQYLRSTGRYGPSPFLVGHYGGCGETAQGFCRTSAVKGGTYILGRRVLSVKSYPSPSDNPPEEQGDASRSTPRYEVRLEDIDEHLTATVLVSAPDYIPLSEPRLQDGSSSFPAHHRVAQCIAVLDRPLVFTPVGASEDTVAPEVEEFVEGAEGAEDESSGKPEPPNYEVDTALLVFPPGTLQSGSTTSIGHALITGEASMSAPRGKFILNISLPLSETEVSSAEELLRPYLDSALSLTTPPSRDTAPATPLFTVFYIHNTTFSPPPPSPTATPLLHAIIAPPPTPLLPKVADAATGNAEAMFWKAVEQLKAAGVRRSVVKESFGKAKEGEEEAADAEESQDIDSFWPPLDASEDDSSTVDEW